MITVNGNTIKATIFPDKTSQIWQLPEEVLKSSNALITWEFFNENEFMHIAQLKTLLDKLDIRAELYIPYLPYARQDKDPNNDTTFALHTFAYLINSLAFSRVTCLDPHSEVASKIIHRFSYSYPYDKFDKTCYEVKANMVCYPDKGALDKYKKMHYHLEYVYGQKVRNQKTGQIESYELFGNPKDKSVLICDDICDGGATFVYLAKSLLTAGAKDVNLFVTHGIFSKGLKPLKEAGINRVFTKNGEISEVQGNIVYKELE